MPITEFRTQIAAAIETTEGTPVTLSASDAFLASNITFAPKVNMNERGNFTSSLSRWAQIPGARSATVEFDVELKGSGTAGSAPALGKLLKACGFGETVVSGTSVTYKPASTSIASLTIGVYEDGLVKKTWGARGDVSLRLEGGNYGVLHFTFTGADFSVTDGSMLSGVTYEGTKPPVFLDASFTIDSYAAYISLIEIGMNNSLALRRDINSESGYVSAVITERKPQLTFDPEQVLVASYDFFGKLKSGNEASLTAVIGSTAGNICTISAPKVQYIDIADDVRDGYRTFGVTCQLNRNSGDDEVSIVFT